jgi:hypothetical protein
VANETRRYSGGEAMAFDDSYMHSVRNDGDVDRVVLLLDVWNPELRGDAISKIRSQCASRAFTQGFDSHFDLTPRPRMSSSATGATEGFDCRLKTICIGDPGVGKSCLVLRMTDLELNKLWSDRYVPTYIADFKIATYQVRNLMVSFQCWDVAKPERYKDLTYTFYRAAHIIFLLIDTTDSNLIPDVLGELEILYLSFFVLLQEFIKLTKPRLSNIYRASG